MNSIYLSHSTQVARTVSGNTGNSFRKHTVNKLGKKFYRFYLGDKYLCSLKKCSKKIYSETIKTIIKWMEILYCSLFPFFKKTRVLQNLSYIHIILPLLEKGTPKSADQSLWDRYRSADLSVPFSKIGSTSYIHICNAYDHIPRMHKVFNKKIRIKYNFGQLYLAIYIIQAQTRLRGKYSFRSYKFRWPKNYFH